MELSKQHIPLIATVALGEAGIQPETDVGLYREFPRLLMQSGAIDVDVQADDDHGHYTHLVLALADSVQATRTSRHHLNAMSLASVVLSALAVSAGFIPFVALFVQVAAACTINLSPEHAAFFLASEKLRRANTRPTAKALAAEMAALLPHEHGQFFNVANLLRVVSELQRLKVDIDVGDPPSQIIRPHEAVLSF